MIDTKAIRAMMAAQLAVGPLLDVASATTTTNAGKTRLGEMDFLAPDRHGAETGVQPAAVRQSELPQPGCRT